MAHLQHFVSRFPRRWRAPVVGVILGLIYGIIEHTLDLDALQAPKIVVLIDDFVVFCLPMILGVLAGLVFNYVRRQQHINRVLSTENTRLEREVFAQLLSSHLLHEIRNPLHNLQAALARWQQQLAPEQAALLERNMERLEAAIKHLTHWNVLSEEINVRETVLLRRWLGEFVQDKVRPQLHAAQIHYEQGVADVEVRMHPVFLEQCFVTLFNNALDAVADGPSPRVIRVSAGPSAQLPDTVEVRFSNTGAPYSKEVLAKQGREPVESRRGMGVGLMLIRRTLEQVGGTLLLVNEHGRATTTLRIPGQGT